MPRKKLVRSNVLPYHVTARTNNREPFPLELERVWDVLGDEGLVMSWVYGVRLHAMVMMPNHIHLMLSTPEEDLGRAMNSLLSSVTRRINRLGERSGHIFGGPYFWSMINSTRYYGHALKYVYRNPVRAKLCESVEEYPYSTLAGLLGDARLPFPIHLTEMGLELGLPSIEASEQLDWLNRPFPAEALELIDQGLHRRVFEPRRGNRCGSPDLLLNLLH